MPRSARFPARRALRHLLIATGTAAAVGIVCVLVRGPGVARRATLATAYPGLGLMAATLWLGPWYVLRGRRPPVSFGWRRDLGIWAGIMAAVHTVVGLQVHFGGAWRYYFLYPPDQPRAMPLRTDATGWANHAGLLAMLALVALVAISNDAALRWLGTARWKTIQRWNYAAFALVGAHALIFQALVHRAAPAVALVVMVLLGTALVQATGYRVRRASGDRGADE